MVPYFNYEMLKAIRNETAGDFNYRANRVNAG